MMDAVSEVIVLRSREPERLQRMLGASLVAHLGLVASVLAAPAAWWGIMEPEPERVMTISLGGAPGPRDGGLSMMGGRPVQQVAPPEAKPVVQPVRPPAAKAPEMVEPAKQAPRPARARDAATDPRSRTPTSGAEIQKGSAVAETGGKGQGFGLSRGGGGTSGYLDVAEFCCPEYLATMQDLIHRRWDYKQQAAGTTVVRFVIQRDGTLEEIEVEKSSGYAALDLMANRAVLLTRQLPPLPAAFTGPSLTVHLIFEYQRP
jgi:protein TonB